MKVFGTGESHVADIVLRDELKAGRSPTGWWAGFDDPDGNAVGTVEFSS